LEAGKCTNIADKHTKEKVIHILALGHLLNALDLRLKNFIRPLGNARQEILKCLESLTWLLVAYTGCLGIVINAPKTIGDVWNQNTT
jgi:hypothetical protein